MPQQVQNLDLQERIRDPADIVLGAVPGGDERLKVLDEKRNRLLNIAH